MNCQVNLQIHDYIEPNAQSLYSVHLLNKERLGFEPVDGFPWAEEILNKLDNKVCSKCGEKIKRFAK